MFTKRGKMSDDSHLNSSLRKIAKGAGISFIGLAIASILGFISRVILARFLGAEDYGLISLGIAVYSITIILGIFGMGGGVTRFVSYYRGKGDEARIKGSIISALKISFSVSFILASALFLASNWIATNVFNEPDLAIVLKVCALPPPFLVAARVLLSATVGFEDMRYKVYVNEIIQNVLRFFLVTILMILGFGVLGGIFGWIAPILLMPFFAFYFLEKRVFPILNTKVKAISINRELLSFSLPLVLVGFSSLIMNRTDTLMIGFFLSMGDVGIYNAAMPATRLMRIGLLSIGSIFMPVVTGFYSQGKFEDVRASYSIVTKWLLSLSFPLFLIMFLFADPIIRVLFGVEYISGALALSILASGFFIFSVFQTSGGILTAFGKTRLNMISSFTAAVTNFLLNLFLIPIYGINGAAIATALSFALMAILNFAFVYNTGKMQPFRISHIKIPLAAGLSAGAIYGLSKLFFDVVPFYILIPLFLFYLIIYFFFLLILKSFEKEDLMIMKAIDQRLGTKSDWIRDIISWFL